MTAALCIGEALGIDPFVIATFLPAIEAGMVRGYTKLESNYEQQTRSQR